MAPESIQRWEHEREIFYTNAYELWAFKIWPLSKESSGEFLAPEVKMRCEKWQYRTKKFLHKCFFRLPRNHNLEGLPGMPSTEWINVIWPP